MRSTQLNLAGAATDAADTTTEIAAYKAFLKLAPTDSEAPTARKALKAAEAAGRAQQPRRQATATTTTSRLRRLRPTVLRTGAGAPG